MDDADDPGNLETMSKVAVSYQEIYRNGVHALRGLGYSFAIAERSARTLATAQAATGGAFRALMESSQSFRGSAGERVIVKRDEAREILIDCQGKSLLELSPFLIDAFAAGAHNIDDYCLTAFHWGDEVFLADMAIRGRTVGLPITVTYQGKAQRSPLSFHISAEGIHDAGQPDHTSSSDANMLTIRTGGKKTMSAARLETTAAAWFTPDQWLSRFDQALVRSLWIDEDEFRFFSQCVGKIWLPTSERSRKQQG